jgi:hypothetical protein
MPAANKHIGKMSAEVTTRFFARPLTVSDNPSCGAVEPTLRQYAGMLYEMYAILMMTYMCLIIPFEASMYISKKNDESHATHAGYHFFKLFSD